MPCWGTHFIGKISCLGGNNNRFGKNFFSAQPNTAQYFISSLLKKVIAFTKKINS